MHPRFHTCSGIYHSVVYSRHYYTQRPKKQEAKKHDGFQLLAKHQEQKVLWLQISVAHLPLVHVEDGAQHLLHHNGRILLGKLTHLDDSIEELTPGTKLHGLLEQRICSKSQLKLKKPKAPNRYAFDLRRFQRV